MSDIAKGITDCLDTINKLRDENQELRAFEGSDALGAGDFSVCIRGADRIEAQAARIAELEVAINAVHRHAMAQSGDRTFDQCSAALGYIDDICRAALAGGKDE